ncbi:MAG: hypothetical protein KID00_01970 [Clostridium argentinense]|uniref:Recombination protein U homolog n=1 Tax=Clostridium faecium TaxID=2762223 RepID=A0ABR8YWK6_9CLOT|nr:MULTISPECIES: hypothetical protein [Clostridium]MBD8048559.1 hypothetical protein [Clostridium faecium]MBS5822625.1 hypothetical protein [Clostridium argentinense]MDU1347810.1 hypothetical protein [Clostridium argentinense]
MKKIYIMLTFTGTTLSRVIKIYTRNDYSHASIALDPELSEMYSFGRKKPRNPFIGGFIKEKIDDGVYKRFYNTECIVYSMDVTFEQYEKVKEIIKEFEKEQDKYRYNFLGVLAVVFKMSLDRKYHYFCSQFVSEVLERSGIFNFDREFTMIKPSDIQKLENLNVVYRGLLRDYAYSNELMLNADFM